MAFDREMWGEIFSRNNIPKYPCPNCNGGRLQAEVKSIRVEEPQFSKLSQMQQDWEPEWTVERFQLLLRCESESCGEVVTVHGDTRIVECENDEHGWEMLTVLRPQSFFPPPPMIALPKEVPVSLVHEFRAAFALYWVDSSACANRLRVTVERLLDNFGVVREQMGKSDKLQRLDLNARIKIFEASNSEHAETLTALRMIGNLGSHGEPVSYEALLDAMEVYEDSLSELYGQRSKRMAALKQKIIGAKGRY